MPHIIIKPFNSNLTLELKGLIKIGGISIQFYLAIFVHFIIGKFDFFKRHHLFAELFTGVRGVGVGI